MLRRPIPYVFGAALLAGPAALYAHSGDGSSLNTPMIDPKTGEVVYPGLYWDMWFDGQLVALLAAVVVVYALLIGPLRRRIAPQAPLPTGRAALFLTGIALFYVTVSSSIDEIGEVYLFSVHMVQHNILVYPIPLLLIAGLPPWLLVATGRTPVLGPLARVLTHPVAAWFLFNVGFAVWHIPALYEWALRDQLVHDLEHASFLFTAILMWWPIAGPAAGVPRVSWGGQVVYELALMVGQIPVFAYVTFAETVQYPTYAAAQRLIDLSPIQDQIAGGAIMKVTGMVVLFGALIYSFLRWYEHEGAADDAIRPRRMVRPGSATRKAVP